MTRVVVVQEMVPHYRVSFFDALRTALAEQGVTLDVVTSPATGTAADRNDEGPLDFASVVGSRRIGPFVWQSALRQVRDADLVIVEQANRNLAGHLMRLLSRFGGPPVALWGHGGNLQRPATDLRERLKRRLTAGAAWFFAYTEGSAERARRCGVDPRRITVVQNAVQTRRWDGSTKAAAECVYVGGLYEAKRLELLLEASDLIAAAVPDFRLHVVGDGPQRGLVTGTARAHVTYHGVLTGADRDAILHRAQLTLMPGLVGLVVLDAFAAAAPLVTIADSLHSPEIEYLEAGANGVMLPAGTTAQEYAAEVVQLLECPDDLLALRAGCAAAAEMYTLDEMVARFADGVMRALAGGRSHAVVRVGA